MRTFLCTVAEDLLQRFGTNMHNITVVFPGIIAHLEDIVLRRHTEGNRETAGQQAAIVAVRLLHDLTYRLNWISVPIQAHLI